MFGVGTYAQSSKTEKTQPRGRDTVNVHNIIAETPTSKASDGFTLVDNLPQFKGDLKKYIDSVSATFEIQAPNERKAKVSVRVFIDEDGNLHQPKVLTPTTALKKVLAMQIVAGMPQWMPARKNGMSVSTYYTINFYL